MPTAMGHARISTTERYLHPDSPACPSSSFFGRERFYRQNALRPGRWLRVVVDLNDDPGWTVTAFVRTTTRAKTNE